MTVPSPADDSVGIECINCGAAITPTAKFCLECGATQSAPLNSSRGPVEGLLSA